MKEEISREKKIDKIIDYLYEMACKYSLDKEFEKRKQELNEESLSIIRNIQMQKILQEGKYK